MRHRGFNLQRKILIAAFGCMLLVLILPFAFRFYIKGRIESEETRSLVERRLEANLRSVLPVAKIKVDQLEMTGLGQIRIRNLEIKNERLPGTDINLQDVVAAIDLMKLWRNKEISLTISTVQKSGGDVQAMAVAPLPELSIAAFKNTLRSPLSLSWEYSGIVTDVTIMPWIELFYGESNSAFVRLIAGRFNAHFSLTRVPRKGISGNWDGVLRDAIWILDGDPKRHIDAAVIPYSFTFANRQIKTVSPIAVTDAKGKVAVTGSVTFSKKDDSGKAWDVKVASEGSPQLANAASRFFKCLPPMPGQNFHATGSFSEGMQCK